MSRPANPPREELLAVGAFLPARAAAAEVARARRCAAQALPAAVGQAVEATDRLVQARLLGAEMLADSDPKDGRVRACAAPLYELAEQWNQHPDHQLRRAQGKLTGLTAQPAPKRSAR
ncbi:hypothetical protein [Streptomyces sp. CC224B]|uniref:hypothetical protein n=1 Tax=Streptomyces sp. CC224B TaxID=3044571 RepID=UPI0024A99024|nr:hypothetical protein [Streptomyces sp. CC224B]